MIFWLTSKVWFKNFVVHLTGPVYHRQFQRGYFIWSKMGFDTFGKTFCASDPHIFSCKCRHWLKHLWAIWTDHYSSLIQTLIQNDNCNGWTPVIPPRIFPFYGPLYSFCADGTLCEVSFRLYFPLFYSFPPFFRQLVEPTLPLSSASFHYELLH